MEINIFNIQLQIFPVSPAHYTWKLGSSGQRGVQVILKCVQYTDIWNQLCRVKKKNGAKMVSRIKFLNLWPNVNFSDLPNLRNIYYKIQCLQDFPQLYDWCEQPKKYGGGPKQNKPNYSFLIRDKCIFVSVIITDWPAAEFNNWHHFHLNRSV